MLLLKRCRIAGQVFKAGETLMIPATRLRVAAHLIATGAGRAADDDTATAVQLLELCKALP